MNSILHSMIYFLVVTSIKEEAELALTDIEGIDLVERGGQFELQGKLERESDRRKVEVFLNRYPEIRDKTAHERRDSSSRMQPTVFLELVLVEVKKSAFEKLGFRLQSPISTATDLKIQFGGRGSSAKVAVDPIRNFLDLALQKGEAKIHAKQSVVTENGKPGEFQVGGQFPIKVVSGYISRVEFKDFGLILKFTPSLRSKDFVHLVVNSEISEIDMGSLVDGIPVIQKKELKTQLNCRLNEMVAIGGIVRASSSRSSDEVPGLGQIPILGRLFQSEDFRRQKSEAYIFITPKKMDAPWLPSMDL